jgi:Ca2+:H+ antiporter
VVSLLTGWTLTLGLDIKSSVLLLLSLFICTLSLGTGRTTVLHGTIHLVIFAVFLLLSAIP